MRERAASKAAASKAALLRGRTQRVLWLDEAYLEDVDLREDVDVGRMVELTFFPHRVNGQLGEVRLGVGAFLLILRLRTENLRVSSLRLSEVVESQHVVEVPLGCRGELHRC